mmetsp:Transcript_13004/g.54463  ORF Transcript_13004/g.54463 Transcript_13004/m.54463 type:complete len:275 (+) Transcript_13004:181-1005(+)
MRCAPPGPSTAWVCSRGGSCGQARRRCGNGRCSSWSAAGAATQCAPSAASREAGCGGRVRADAARTTARGPAWKQTDTVRMQPGCAVALAERRPRARPLASRTPTAPTRYAGRSTRSGSVRAARTGGTRCAGSSRETRIPFPSVRTRSSLCTRSVAPAPRISSSMPSPSPTRTRARARVRASSAAARPSHTHRLCRCSGTSPCCACCFATRSTPRASPWTRPSLAARPRTRRCASPLSYARTPRCAWPTTIARPRARASTRALRCATARSSCAA